MYPLILLALPLLTSGSPLLPRQIQETSAYPPLALSNLLSTTTLISFLVTDTNPSAPTDPSPISCSANMAAPDGTFNSSLIPYAWVPCADTNTGANSSQWNWLIEDYANPGLFVLRLWHGYLDPSSGPCAVYPDGTPFFCNTNYYAERQVDVDAGDLVCTPDIVGICQGVGTLDVPIVEATA